MAERITPRRPVAILFCALIVLNAGTAWGSGFYIREQSATAQGNSFAGATAGADDISYMFYNPAGLTQHTQSQALSSASYIIVRSKSDDLEGTTQGGATIEGERSTGDIGEDALVPALYALWVPRQDFRFGVGINAPFGLVTDNPVDSVARYHGTRSELQTINVNPVVAYKAADWLSLGLGLQVQYADAQLENAIDFGTLAGFGQGTLANDGQAKLQGDDFGLGFNVGVMIEPWTGTRIGASYRSGIHHDVDGHVDFDLGRGVGPLVAAASGGAFVRSGARADLNTPDVARFGIYQDITDEWAVMADVAWTDWSDFDTLRIEFDNPAQPDSITVQDWDDTIFVALGATYRPKEVEGLTLRLGAAFDDSPNPDNRRTPRLADNDGYWLSIGASYKPFDWTEIALSYTHVLFMDGDIDLDAVGPNATRGNLTGSYETSVDVLSLSARLTF